MTSPIRHQPNYLPPPDRCTGQPLIEMAQIVKTFKNASGEFTALREVTACFYPGEFVSVVGKSGSGKSTLVNMLTGIDHPTSGTVRVGDTYVHSLSENDMSVWRGKNLGIVFQFFQLLPTLTLLENVMLPMYLSRLYTPAGRESRALELLKLVGLEKLAEKLPAAVSGGQQQSAAIARALSNDPPILIADEPTGNLDSRTADEVFDLFTGLIDQGKSILMVTHDIGLARRTNRTLLISDGEIINPWVAGALPHIGHSQMLWLTHHLKPKMLLPGETFKATSDEQDWLLMVTGGRLEVMARSHNGNQTPFVNLEGGTFLYSQDLKINGWAGSSVKASLGEPVELLIVEGDDFQHWLTKTPSAQTSLQHAAQEHRANWSRQALPEAVR